MMLNIDLDTKILENWEGDWIETRKAILKKLGLTYQGYVKTFSLQCKKCRRSWVVLPNEVELFTKCKYCGHKELTQGRGYHVQIEIKEDLSEEERNKYEFLLGCDEMKVALTQAKIDLGITNPSPNLFFSAVRWRKPQSKECHNCPHINICKKIFELAKLYKDLKKWEPKKDRCEKCGARKKVDNMTAEKNSTSVP